MDRAAQASTKAAENVLYHPHDFNVFELDDEFSGYAAVTHDDDLVKRDDLVPNPNDERVWTLGAVINFGFTIFTPLQMHSVEYRILNPPASCLTGSVWSIEYAGMFLFILVESPILKVKFNEWVSSRALGLGQTELLSFVKIYLLASLSSSCT